jgi:hypothetical protein
MKKFFKSLAPKPVQDAVFGAHKQAKWMLDPSLRNMNARLRLLQGKFAGQRCFLMGNGPSLNKMDLSLFKGEIVWGSNKCYLLFDRIEWRPRFYMGIDARVVPDIQKEVNQLTRNLPETTCFFPVRFRTMGVLESRPNVYWYNEVVKDPSDLPFGVFTRDASNMVTTASTVTIAMMQVAVYLGFNPIYLIGCDTNYTVPATVQVEGSRNEKFTSTRDDDPNHFAPNYFGANSKWHDPKPERMLQHYEQSKSACDLLGVQVYNATVGGKLEAFPRVDYRDLFKK